MNDMWRTKEEFLRLAREEADSPIVLAGRRPVPSDFPSESGPKQRFSGSRVMADPADISEAQQP